MRAAFGSREFARSPRLVSFLTYVVETALAGKPHQIKESLIAVEVYGRQPDYSPSADPAVRVDARRLRDRLKEYYAGSGAAETVRIDIPKGTYVPVITFLPAGGHPRASANPAPQPPRYLASRVLRGRSGLAAAAVLLTAGAVTGIRYLAPDVERARTGSIAVLPFVNLSGDRDAAGAADAFTEELRHALVRTGGVRVAPGAAVAGYNERAVNVKQIRRDHGVDAVLDGSIRRLGKRLVITTQLTDTRSGLQLWANRSESEEAATAEGRRQFAAGLAWQLRGFFRDPAADRSPQPEVDARTMELYHEAGDLLRIPVEKNGPPETLPETVVAAVRLFREVTARRPEFARGWAGLAEAAAWQYELGGNQPRDLLSEATAAARRAVELEPAMAEGWTLLASILLFREWDLEGAKRAGLRAIELDPRNTRARRWYIDALRIQGKHYEARAEVDKAARLQPFSAEIGLRRAVILFEDGRYREALDAAQAAAELTNQVPLYPIALWIQGLCLEQQSRFSEAEKAFRAALSRQPHDWLNEAALGHLLAATTRKREAEQMLAELRSHRTRNRLTHVAQALIHTALGNQEQALAALETALAEREDAVLSIASDPRFRPIRSAPRFEAIVAAIRRKPGGDLRRPAAGT
ncbi:MAG: tetratricopeptide repeat protein [Bryobacterales bacterium]|nr:tetratricopeptide repeat protein [Bryobacterales bacterium]